MYFSYNKGGADSDHSWRVPFRFGLGIITYFFFKNYTFDVFVAFVAKSFLELLNILFLRFTYSVTQFLFFKRFSYQSLRLRPTY